jgi:acyl carrier protein
MDTESPTERKDRIRKLIAKIIEVDAARVTDDARFQQDLGADSMGAIELLSQLETTFKIRISENELENMNTLQDTYKVVCKAAGWEP